MTGLWWGLALRLRWPRILLADARALREKWHGEA